MSNLETALALAGAGLYVFPCQGTAGDSGKVPPAGFGWKGESSTDADKIRRWFMRWPNATVALDLGKSGLFVVDCDKPDNADQLDGQEWFESVILEAGADAFPFLTSRTPSGGVHYIFRQPPGEPLGNGRGGLPKKKDVAIDVRGRGGYVIAPGATMQDGRAYVLGGSIADVPAVPEWLLSIMRTAAADEPASMPAPLPAVLPVVSFPPSTERVGAYSRAGFDAEVAEVRTAPKGTRNDTLNTSAFKIGSMVGAGWVSESEAFSALVGAVAGWPESRKTIDTLKRGLREGMGHPRPALPEDETPNMVAPLMARLDSGELYNADTGEIIEAAPLPVRRRLVATPYVRRDPRAVPPRQFLYGRHLIRQFVSATIAPGAAGKSSLICAEALALVTGRDLLGEKVWGGAKRVWLWNGEDPADELARKIEATCLHYGISASETEGRLFVDSGRDSPLVIATQIRLGFEIAEPVVADLIETIRSHRIDVVMIDPFISSHRVGENDNNAIDAVVKTWAAIADATDCAIELVHHARKTNGVEVGVEDGRGASSLIAAARDARVLNTMTPDEAATCGAENRLQYFRVSSGKANLSARDGKTSWRRLTSVSLDNGRDEWPEGDHVGVVERWEPGDADSVNPLLGYSEEQLREIQNRVEHSEIGWRKEMRSPEWAGVAIADVLAISITGKDGKRDTAKAGPVADILQAMLTNGMLRIEIGTDRYRKPKEYVRVGVVKGSVSVPGGVAPWNLAA